MSEPESIRTFRIASVGPQDSLLAPESVPSAPKPTDTKYTRAVAARRASLPPAPVLDLVDYLLAVCGLDRATLFEVTKDEVFLACLTRCTSASGVRMLGHLASYFLRHRTRPNPKLSDDEAIDCLRIAYHCWRLPSTDSRQVFCDYKQWPTRFPDLFPDIPVGSPENLVYRQRLIEETGTFAADHPLRLEWIWDADDMFDYVDYWIARSEEQIAEYFKDERFVAGLAAMGEGLLSFHGLLETVYGREYCDRVLTAKQFVMFPGLDGHLSALALIGISNQIASGQRSVPPDLRTRYPDVFRFYAPEAFGRRSEPETG
jgi:hypothetical protein